MFHSVKDSSADQDGTDALLQKSCEGRFEVAIGAGIHNNELHAQRAGRFLYVCDGGLDTRKGRVRENAEHGNIAHQFVEQLQLFWRQLGR